MGRNHENDAMSRRDPQPAALSPQTFHVLLALADGEKHGYGLAREVATATGGRVRLSAGTLYGILRRATEEGLLAECPPPAGEAGDERRRYYRLTAHGREVAAAEAERLERLVGLARARRLLRPAGEAR